jgi:hypothetical protein
LYWLAHQVTKNAVVSKPLRFGVFIGDIAAPEV